MTAVPPRPAAPEVIHACPPGTSGVMPCCGRTPFEVPRTDRMALNPANATCGVTAPDATAGDGLREAIAQAIWDSVDGYMSGVPWERAKAFTFQEAKAYRQADAVLALPALRDVLAAAARDAEKVARVRAAHVPTHSYCLVDDRDRDVELVGNNPDCEHWTSYCRACDYAWPCLTIRALDPS